MKINKHVSLTLLLLFSIICVNGTTPEVKMTMSKQTLMDKIKGGWAGQVFGCTYGGPTEFRYNGIMIPDSVEIVWNKDCCKWWYDNDGGLYDDVYMDLTFVEVFDKYGIDVHVDSLANAFANADYKLWHANQAARNNILNGIPAPMSGHWINNPHADDIDFQIEADFAGLMSPAMPNSASEICDRVGHIMCYGDGWYGGVYVAALYSLAFVSDDVDYVVNQALQTIPQESAYYGCIKQVIEWCGQHPDWKTTWQLIADRWFDEINCPQGTKNIFNIDAKVNSAYVVMGLLYGKKDIELSMDISTRCGADSDCNPATVAGILGTMLGYSNIPDKWTVPCEIVADRNFDHTDISLNKTYQLSYNHALQMIKRNGGKVGKESVTIKTQLPTPVTLESCFTGLDLAEKKWVAYKSFDKQPFELKFKGCAIVCEGKIVSLGKSCPEDYVAQLEIDIDGNKEIIEMPLSFILRRHEIYWNYKLSDSDHNITVKWLNPRKDAELIMDSYMIYKNK